MKHKVIICLIICMCLLGGNLLNSSTCNAAKTKKVTSLKITNLNSNFITLQKGGAFTIKPQILPSKATNKKVTWSSSDKTIATVSSKGVVKANKEGICEVTGTTKDGSNKKVSFLVKVYTDTEYFCDGSWEYYNDRGDKISLAFSTTGNYDMANIGTQSLVHDGEYQLDTNSKTIVFNGTQDGGKSINETWDYKIVSNNKLTLTKDKTQITYTRSSVSTNKKNLCTKQGLLYSIMGKSEVGISGYIGTAATVTIPSTINKLPVTSISGFTGNTIVKNVNISDNVKEINYNAFKDCTNLQSVTMSDGVQYIRSGAFQGCTSLENIQLSSNLISMESTVFRGCTKLTEIEIPDLIEIVFSGTFYNCTSLKKLSFPSAIQKIEPEILSGCNDVVIYGYKGTCAETFAKENNFKFIER